MTDRLTIAMHLLAGHAANPAATQSIEHKDIVETALGVADALLAAAEKPAVASEGAAERVRGAIKERERVRGRPLTEEEKLDNLKRALNYAEKPPALPPSHDFGDEPDCARCGVFGPDGGDQQPCAPAAPAIVPVAFDADGLDGDYAEGLEWEATHLNDRVHLTIDLRPGEDAGVLTATLLAAVGRAP